MNKKLKRVLAVMLCLGVVLGSPGIAEAAGTIDFGELTRVDWNIRTTSQNTEKESDGTEANKAETNKAETNTTETNKPETNKTESNKTETNKTESNKTETNKAESNKAESNKAETNKAETNKAETNKAETNKAETNKAETNKAETNTAESNRESKEQPYIYWNPSAIPVSNAEGQSKDSPIADFEKVLAKAAELKKKLNTEITVYAMASMKITNGDKKTYDGNGIRLSRWEGRPADDTFLFQVERGELNLSNMTITSTGTQNLIRIKEGTFGIGNQLVIGGTIYLDYQPPQNKMPLIQVNSPLPTGRKYLLAGNPNENNKNSKVAAIAYLGGESGKSFHEHFLLTGDLAKKWKLGFAEDNTGRELYIELPDDENKKEVLSFEIGLPTKNTMRSAAKAEEIKTIYWNVDEDATSAEGDRPAIAGGNDKNTGLTVDYPVRSWKKAKEALGGNGGTIVVMSPIIVGASQFDDKGTTITSLDGEGKYKLKQWSRYPTEMIIIPPEQELSVSNIEIEGSAGSDGTLIRIADSYGGNEGKALGKLIIGTGVKITGGSIQTELESNAKDRLPNAAIEITETTISPNSYLLYFSGINGGQEFQNADVIQGPDGSDAANYLDVFMLHKENTGEGWGLRRDSFEDDGTVSLNRIELYREYKYKGIYLNGQKGDDSWIGGNCDWPVKTFGQAKKLLFENWDKIEEQDRVIYICDTVDITEMETWDFIDENGNDKSQEAKISVCETHDDHTLNHDSVPSTLVSVKDKGDLTTSALTIDYNFSKKGSVLIDVLPGGAYTSEKGTTLQGAQESYSGIGVQVQGAEGKKTKFTMVDGLITKRALGVSVSGIDEGDTLFTMNGGSIRDNNRKDEFGYGAGLYLSNAGFEMNGGEIRANISSLSETRGYGGGIYATGSNTVITLKGGSITKNTALGFYSGETNISQGSGVYLEDGTLYMGGNASITENQYKGSGSVCGGGVYLTRTATMVMEGGVISGNSIKGSVNKAHHGAGIYNAGKLTIKGGTIKGNGADFGGGIASAGGKVVIEGGIIQDNTARNGGGLFLSGGEVEIGQVEITGNTASVNGGGLYLSGGNVNVKIGQAKIIGNTAGNGGGLFLSEGNAEIGQAEIIGNTAENGGGLFIGASLVHLKGGTVSGNTASKNGGGVYCGSGNTYFGKDIELIDNDAEQLGSSCYSEATTWFLGGEYEAKLREGSKGIYLDIKSISAGNDKIYMDPGAMTVRDHVYLNTTESKLYLLNPVSKTGAASGLPLLLNEDVFGSGSVLVLPAEKESVTVLGTEYTFSKVTDAGQFLDYFMGGTQPNKTQISAFDKKIVLVGEGIYLDGGTGDDGNDGSSPTKAVRTFVRAEVLLREKIAEAKVNARKPDTNDEYDPDGFEPFIYICGEVSVAADADGPIWELDYENSDFTQSNNEGKAQIKRFASYYGNMISVVGNGASGFKIGKLLMDGNAEAMDGTNRTISPMLVVGKSASVTLENCILQNNYGIAVQVSGGFVVMKGTSDEKNDGAVIRNSGDWAVKVEDGGTFKMQDHAGIENPYYIDNIPIPGAKSDHGGIYVQGDNSCIDIGDTSYIWAQSRYGIGVYGRDTVSEKAMVSLSGDAVVWDSNYGIYMNGPNCIVSMERQAKLSENGTGVFVEKVSKSSRFFMKDTSALINVDTRKSGFSFGEISAENKDSKDNFELVMEDSSSISWCDKGIESSKTGGSLSYVKINMKGNSRIHGCYYGIYLTYSGNSKEDKRPQIHMKEQAAIGGSLGNGNLYGGVISSRAIDINMEGDAEISYNGSHGIRIWRSPSGIADYSGPSNISMSGTAAIKNNGMNGIITEDANSTSGIYRNEVGIELKGSASVRDNSKKGIIVTQLSTLTVGDDTTISGNQSTERGSAIDCTGQLYLGGKAAIDGEVYIYEMDKPIILTSEPEGQSFQIGCADTFVGMAIVKPDSTNITDAAPFVGNFVGGTNFPKGKSIKAQSPYLIVEGENNVYLAGSGKATATLTPGNDKNTGRAVGAPVATFGKALEILKTLEEGANIIICNYPVDFGTQGSAKPGGDTWSFGDSNTVTNKKGQTWEPKVLRYEKYKDNMISIGGFAEFTLENITIDGNKDKFSSGETASGAIIRSTSADAVINLNQGAVLQNNRKDTLGAGIYGNATVNIAGGSIQGNETNYSGGGIYIYSTGTVNITGGSIQGNKSKSFGGGIYIDSGSTVNITGGSIQGNESGSSGGGIYISSAGTVNMTDGNVTGNKINSEYSGSPISGAGISNFGMFKFSGGTISGNIFESAKQDMQGMALYNNGQFNMSGSAAILNHKLDIVVTPPKPEKIAIKGTVYNSGTMTATGGSIAGNELVYSADGGDANAWGGGMFVDGGEVTISGLEIQDNLCQTLEKAGSKTSVSKGGGIYVQSGTLNFMSGSIQGNRAESGAGIYYETSAPAPDPVIISGGVIRDNIPYRDGVEATMQNAGVYINGSNFQLKGGGSIISDRIYLQSKSCPIVLSGSIYQRNRIYKIDCADEFAFGDIIVTTDEDVILDATGYLPYFQLSKGGYVLEKQTPNLVLKQSIYIDGEKGSDDNDGRNPDEAVATMAGVEAIAGNNKEYIVYASGPICVSGAESWDLPATSWISRYTGFTIIGEDKIWPAYDGNIVLAKQGADLQLGAVTIYGRREIDQTIKGDSILKVEAGASVSMSDQTVLKLNSLPAGKKGGAVNIDGGTLKVNGGEINNTAAAEGSAIYQNGRLYLADTPSISGEVYLAGTKLADDASNSSYIEVAENYTPGAGKTLSIDIENVYGGRKVIEYPENVTPGSVEKNYYHFDTAISAMHYLENRSGERNVLELQQKGFVYINGVDGEDAADGKTPKGAVRTLKKAYEVLGVGGEGGLIIVVNTVTVSNGDNITLQNTTSVDGGNQGIYESEKVEVNAKGPVYFQRYAQPDAWKTLSDSDQYKIENFTGTMLKIEKDGILEIDNLFFDGHSRETAGDAAYAASPVEAKGPIFHVEGTLITKPGSKIYYNNNTAVDAKGAGVYVDGGTFNTKSIEITNVTTPENVKGSAIYQDGICILDGGPNIDGSIHLIGNNSPDSSKFIEMTESGFVPKSEILLTVDDPYQGRTMVQFQSDEANWEKISKFRLEQSVTDRFSMGKRAGQPEVLELQHRKRVYIDGGGSDDNDGETPAKAVKTLKKAYEQLKKIGGGYLYVVGTVDVSEDIRLTAASYSDSQSTISIVGGTVEIRRYAVPNAMGLEVDYVEPGNHKGVLFQVKAGGIFSLEDISIDGHREAINVGDKYQDVKPGIVANAPLITTELGGILNLNKGAVLEKNDNQSNGGMDSEGGAVANYGTLNFSGALIQGNRSGKGAGIYQAGSFTIMDGAAGLAVQDEQEIYLATENKGTADQPAWGTDYVIHMQEFLEDGVELKVDADHPVNGRDIVVYDNADANVSDGKVDNEYDHYTLGSKICAASPTMYLVEAKTEKNILELYNYEVLDVSLPLEVFLVAVQHPKDTGTKSQNIRNAEFQAPEYTIANHGKYQTKISVVGFQNENSSAGIGGDEMILVKDQNELTGPDLYKKLYLAVSGADGESGNGFAELADAPLSEAADGTPIDFGMLQPEESGKFTFSGTADESFFDHYKDETFSSSIADPNAHIREHAKAKYRMVYKFELVR